MSWEGIWEVVGGDLVGRRQNDSDTEPDALPFYQHLGFETITEVRSKVYHKRQIVRKISNKKNLK